MYCNAWPDLQYLIFTSGVPQLLYYSHIPVAVISLLLGIFIFAKNPKSLVSKILLIISLLFGLWIVADLIVWVNPNSQIVMFFWSLFGIIFSLISVFCVYFYEVFTDGKDISFYKKVALSAFVIPMIALTPTIYNLNGFDRIVCGANESKFLIFYKLVLGIIVFSWIIISAVAKHKKIPVDSRKQSILLATGIEAFLLSFFVATFIASYLTEKGLIGDFGLEQYGLFGMVIFMAFLTYMIVKFKAFDIKLIATQALIWASVILIGSQFFFIQNNTNRVLTGITLITTSIIGLMIVRSVKKEIALREELEIANNNQQSLIHFVSHQLKGFFTKSKMIFAGLLEEDFGQTSDLMKSVAKEGLLSDNNAVAMIQDILGASNYKKGTIAYDMKEIDLAKITKDVCDSFKKEIDERSLELKIDISEKPVVILADQTQIIQVFKNLVDNSIRYTPSGSVTVSLKESIVDGKHKALFEISDTGVGLSEKDKSKLFTEGGKGEDSLKYNVNSTGYGLFIVKKIVENHNGKIWAESEGRGKGSRFCVVLPLK